MNRIVGYTSYTNDNKFGWYKFGGFPPEKLNMNDHIKGKGKFCPALVNIFKNTYVIRSPFDLDLRIKKREDTELWWVEVLPESSLNPEYFNDIFVIHPFKDQNNKNWPMMQMNLPFTFISDDDVYIEAIAPLLEYNQLPGIIMGGTYSIYDWHRPINWGFEWRDTTKDIHIKRGQPLMYIRFNPRDRNDTVTLKEVPITEDLKEALGCDQTKKVMINMSDVLMKYNREHRKKRLIKSHIKYILDRFISRINH